MRKCPAHNLVGRKEKSSGVQLIPRNIRACATYTSYMHYEFDLPSVWTCIFAAPESQALLSAKSEKLRIYTCRIRTRDSQASCAMNFLKSSIPCIKSAPKLHRQAVLEEPSSPHTLKDKSDSPYSIHQQPAASPARSSSSSSSGSYDLDDAMPEATRDEAFKSAAHSVQASAAEQEIDVSLFLHLFKSCTSSPVLFQRKMYITESRFQLALALRLFSTKTIEL